MSRGPQPRVSGRVEWVPPRPDTVIRLMADCAVTAAVMGLLLFGSAWIAGLI